MTPLLSIIIPTKNRQFTAVFAIESAFDIISDQIEIIVQDCSDDNSLEGLLAQKFSNDPRIKYFYTDDKPSLTDNWNLAISNTKGKYICGIGDDDAVLPRCLEIVKWMDKNKVDAVLGALVVYIWKDAYIGSFSNGKITYSQSYTGEIFEVNICQEFLKKAIECGFGYTDNLPNLYHGIIRKELIETHKKTRGHYLSSTSFDVYNAFVLAAYASNLYYIDIPITVRGVSGKSNTNRIYAKKSDAHFKEFKKVDIPETLPYLLNVEISIAESTIVALRDIKRFDLIKNMNLAVVYGKIGADDTPKVFKYYRQFKKVNNQDLYKHASYFSYYFKFLRNRIKNKSINSILKVIYKILPSVNALMERVSGKMKIQASDILEGNKALENHLSEKKIEVRYTVRIKPLPLQSVPWD